MPVSRVLTSESQLPVPRQRRRPAAPAEPVLVHASESELRPSTTQALRGVARPRPRHVPAAAESLVAAVS